MRRARRLALGSVSGLSAVFLGAGLSALSCAVEGTVLREVDDDTVDGSPSLADATTDLDGTAPDGDAGSRFPADAARVDASGIFAGQFFSCGLTSGSARCWGSNVLGQLGIDSLQNQLAPTPVVDAPGFTMLSLGESHSCGVAFGSGALFCWGADGSGQLGQGEPASALDAGAAHPTPLAVSLPHPVVRVALGYDHTCAILTDGSLWCWGENGEGQLGLGDVFGAPDMSSPQRVGSAYDWRDVSGGQGHTCGLRAASDGGASSDGQVAGATLWCWGRNSNDELGLGAGEPVQLRSPTQVGTAGTWVQLDVGQDDGCAVRRDGTLWCWGSNGSGQLTPAVGSNVAVPTQIGTDTDWSYVSTDTFVTCGLKIGGALLCWGRNAEGQLGVGDTTDRTSPTATGSGAKYAGVSVGRFHTCALTATGATVCAGDNESGQLGVGDSERRSTFQ